MPSFEAHAAKWLPAFAVAVRARSNARPLRTGGRILKGIRIESKPPSPRRPDGGEDLTSPSSSTSTSFSYDCIVSPLSWQHLWISLTRITQARSASMAASSDRTIRASTFPSNRAASASSSSPTGSFRTSPFARTCSSAGASEDAAPQSTRSASSGCSMPLLHRPNTLSGGGPASRSGAPFSPPRRSSSWTSRSARSTQARRPGFSAALRRIPKSRAFPSSTSRTPPTKPRGSRRPSSR